MRYATNLAVMAALFCCGPGLAEPAAAPPAPTQAAPPSVDAEPQSTSASFGDWVMRCERLAVGAEPRRVCEVAQTVQIQGQPGLVAELAIGRLKKDDLLRVTLVLPVNIGFPSTPKVTIEGKPADTAELAWRRCQAGGCWADASLNDDVIRRWRASTAAGRIESRNAAGRDVALAMSFRGLAQALDALAKE
jgi:invasion protein IalB